VPGSGAGDVFLKRTLTPGEYMEVVGEYVLVPYMHMERMKNEAAAIDYIRRNTNIPVPVVRCAYGRFYIITDIPGVPMSQLPDDNQKAIVMEEVELHLRTMQEMTSKVMGGFLGYACLPARLEKEYKAYGPFKSGEAPAYELVLCHNDLSQYNIMVDKKTLKITAILDWEYAGFYPKKFEGAFYKRPGPSIALKGRPGIADEEDDVDVLQGMVDAWQGIKWHVFLIFYAHNTY
jgi:aminoglycoside phosphotransferase